MSYAELSDITEQVENLQEPDDYRDYYHSVQDSLDLTLHGYKSVDQP
jgi:hypothetical protein